jgi:DNA-binding response OmpR family regulator
MVPVLDGFQVCREVRSRGRLLPILILTARSSEVDKVLGFELGADDYVTKPFGVRELVARVRALLRRGGPRPGPNDRHVLGEAVIDFKRACVEVRGEKAELYHFELEILKLLVAREGEVVSRAEILNAVWGDEAFPTTRTVDFHIHNLRKKIEAEPSRPKHILTVHGIGYRLLAEAD